MIAPNIIFEHLSLIKKNELWPVVASFTMALVLMTSYFVLRPVRDAMASDWSDAELSMLWNIQFFLSIALVAAYNFIVGKVSFRWVVPGFYCAFSCSFFLFYLLVSENKQMKLIEQVFYLWVSAFSLFNLSVFWSFMTHSFNAEQGRRLFATISAGASVGAIAGPSIPVLFVNTLGLDTLMLIASAGLLSVVPIALAILHATPDAALQNNTLSQNACLSGSWWSGFHDALRHPYLRGIAVFILLYVFIGAFIYFIQKNLLADFTRIERTQILGSIDWITNTLTFICAFFITGRLATRAGMTATLSSVPVVLIIGFLALALVPWVTLLLIVKIVRNTGNYAITRPAREMLFNKVSQAQRFKAKPVLDVAVYRGGDAVGASLFALLTEGLGLGLTAIGVLGAILASAWSMVAYRLGFHYERRGDTPTSVHPENTPTNNTRYSPYLP